MLPECGENASIGFGVLLTHPETRIGPYAYLGSYTVLGRVTVERDVLIGSFVSIMNGNRQHGIERLDVPVREQPGVWPHVTIGEDSWIGDRAVVMADVGKHCVVAAGAIVTKPVPDYAIVSGCPATVQRYRRESEAISTVRRRSPHRFRNESSRGQISSGEPFHFYVSLVLKSQPVVCQVLHSLCMGGRGVLAARWQNLRTEFRFVFACLDEAGFLADELSLDGFPVHVFQRARVSTAVVSQLSRMFRRGNVN